MARKAHRRKKKHAHWLLKTDVEEANEEFSQTDVEEPNEGFAEMDKEESGRKYGTSYGECDVRETGMFMLGDRHVNIVFHYEAEPSFRRSIEAHRSAMGFWFWEYDPEDCACRQAKNPCKECRDMLTYVSRWCNI